MSEPHVYLPDEGPCYTWRNDTTRVLVSSEASGGRFTWVEDRMQAAFKLALHLHREHVEAFFILEGTMEFVVGDRTIRAVAGTTICVPPGTPHSARVIEEQPARMLMIYAVAGFDRYLVDLTQLAPEQMNDPSILAALDAKYDIVHLDEWSETSARAAR